MVEGVGKRGRLVVEGVERDRRWERVEGDRERVINKGRE